MYVMYNNRGIALLDSIVAVSVFVVLFIGFFALIQLGLQTVTDNRVRTGALAIATAKIEHIRSLDYAVIGLQGGDPSGTINSIDTETLNNVLYTINTDIIWVDDPNDGLANTGDSKPNDYKSIYVEVSWQEHGGSIDSIVLTSYVANFIPE